MTDSKNIFPSFLVAMDRKRNRVFVLAQPDICAIKIDGQWRTCKPLSDEEIPQYSLIVDPETASFYVNQAKEALLGGHN